MSTSLEQLTETASWQKHEVSGGTGLDCLLVHAPKFQTFYPPLNVYQSCNRMTMGILALADFADRKGYRTRVLHAGIEKALDKHFSFTEYLQTHRPRVIGFSLHFHHGIVDTFQLAEEAREAVPEAFIFLGGFTATFFATDIMETVPAVDAVMKGDSEEPFVMVLEKVVRENSRGFRGVPNLVWRRDGETVENEQSYVTSEEILNDLVYTRFDLLDHADMYPSMPKAFIRTNLPSGLNLKFNRFLGKDRSEIYWGLPVGRGCVSNCFYCGGGARAQLRISNRKGVIFRKPEKVIETIREMIDFGFRGCYVSFDPRPWSQEYYVRLFRLMREQGVDFSFLFSAWGLATREFLDEFARTFDSRSAYLISPETGDEDLRRKARGATSFTNAELLDTLEYADKLGIRTRIYFSIGALEKDWEDFAATLALKNEITKRIDNTEVEAFLIEAEPGAPWHLNPEEYGIKLLRRSLVDFVRDHSSPKYSSMTSLGYTSRFFGNPEMSADDFQRRLLRLKCRYFCDKRLRCKLIRIFWWLARLLGLAPRPKTRHVHMKGSDTKRKSIVRKGISLLTAGVLLGEALEALELEFLALATLELRSLFF